MSTESNKLVVRRFYQEAIYQGRFELIDTLLAPNYSFSSSGSTERYNRNSRAKVDAVRLVKMIRYCGG